MNISELAEQAITQPPDSFFGNDNLWYTHGMSGINVHRDSSVVERSNFNVMTNILSEDFGDEDVDGDWWINHSTHWAVGWVDQIMVRVLIDPDATDKFNEDNLTEIFKCCMSYLEDVVNYVILDESHYYDLFHDEMVKEVNSLCPSWASSNFDPEKIIDLAHSWDLELLDDESWIIGDNFVYVATFVLGMYDDTMIEEMNNDLQYVVDSKDFGRWDTAKIAKDLFSEFLSLKEI